MFFPLVKNDTGWVYVTIVHGGFVVPHGMKVNWGSVEGEIAQWGAIPAERIVGFFHVQTAKVEAVAGSDSPKKIPRGPTGSIFIRRFFRKSDPAAFEYIFNVISRMTP